MVLFFPELLPSPRTPVVPYAQRSFFSSIPTRAFNSKSMSEEGSPNIVLYDDKDGPSVSLKASDSMSPRLLSPKRPSGRDSVTFLDPESQHLVDPVSKHLVQEETENLHQSPICDKAREVDSNNNKPHRATSKRRKSRTNK